MKLPPLAALPVPAVFLADSLPNGIIDPLEVLAKAAVETGGTGGGGTRRHSKVRFVDFVNHQDLYGLVAEIAARVNAQHWRFDLTDLYEQIQLARYEADEKGEYDWHQDFGSVTSCRKLSISIQLSEHDSYEGGDLEVFKAADSTFTAPRNRGAVIMFPAYQLHRVTPVTKGVRHSLVAWISGPPFR
jgi:PKHD-type hydroxylase